MKARLFTPHMLLAAAWTLLFCYLMLSPGQDSVADDISQAFGGTELSDAAGHCVLAFIETLLVFNALRLLMPLSKALATSAVFVMALGAVLETAQIWIPTRGASLLDFTAHSIGVCLCVLVMHTLRMRKLGAS